MVPSIVTVLPSTSANSSYKGETSGNLLEKGVRFCTSLWALVTRSLPGWLVRILWSPQWLFDQYLQRWYCRGSWYPPSIVVYPLGIFGNVNQEALQADSLPSKPPGKTWYTLQHTAVSYFSASKLKSTTEVNFISTASPSHLVNT